MAYSEELATRIRRTLGDRADLTEKRMFGGVAFMIRGHMACGIVGDRLMARLDPDRAASLLEEPHVGPMDFTGRPMRGFLFVEPEGIATAASLRKWVARTVAHAETLPAKPASKRSRR
jgi:hypothetical protein